MRERVCYDRANITLYSNEILTTLARGYNSDPIDMPESETIDQREYEVSPEEYEKAYSGWDRNANAVLQVNDQLTGLPMWLSQAQADMVHRAIRAGQDSVELL